MFLLYPLLTGIRELLKQALVIIARIDLHINQLAVSQLAIQEALKNQKEQLTAILALVTPSQAASIRFSVDLEGQITEGATTIRMTNSQHATASIQPVDKKGQPAPVDGIPVWASSDETIVTVSPAADGMSADVAAVGPLGAAKISVTADADLGSGVASIFGSLDVTVTQGQAVGINVKLGDASEQ